MSQILEKNIMDLKPAERKSHHVGVLVEPSTAEAQENFRKTKAGVCKCYGTSDLKTIY